MQASSVAEFIKAQGDAAEVAARLGRKPEVVRQWKFRGVIPRSAWPEIIDTFAVTMDELRKLEKAA
jgi:hypothetical protein